MNGDISVDVGSALPYAIDKFLSVFEKDIETTAARGTEGHISPLDTFK